MDTNVAVEFYSFYDLMTEGDRHETSEQVLQSPAAAYRAARSRDTIMFGWFCHINRVEARVLISEALSVLLRAVPPERKSDPNNALLKAILYFVKDRVLPRWQITKYRDEPDGLRGNAADDWLLSKAAEEGLALITNEGSTVEGVFDRYRDGRLNLRGKAKERGVPVYTPGEFLQLKEFNPVENGHAFAQSFQAARPRYLQGRADKRAADEALSHLLGLYRYVLFGEVDERYQDSPRATWPPLPPIPSTHEQS